MKRRLGYVDRELCSKCGGVCCDSMPGAAMPEDFGAPDEEKMIRRVTAALRTGNWSIDSWDGDPRDGVDELSEAYFVRPATTNGRDQVRDDSWGGRCVFMSDTGCEIFNRRPSGCRGLQPYRSFSGRDCKVMHSGKADAAIAWIPYRSALGVAISNARNT